MASKLLFLNSLMERRNKPNKECTDDLALVKAAAWAWHQHGSGSEGKAMNEFDVTRTQRTPRPSRYKLEAMRMASDEAIKDQGSSSSPLHSKNSLLDAYEVQSISRQIDDVLESNNSNHHNKNKLVNGIDNTSATSLDSDRGMKKKKKKSRKGFWLRNAAVCGRGEDVVDPSAALRGGDRQSAKRVPAVNLVK